MGLSVRRKKGSKNWHMRGTVAGVFVEESTGTADKRAAGIVAANKELEIVKGGIVGRGQSATFLEAAVSYLETISGREQKRCVGKLLQHFSTTPIWDIGQTQAETCALKLYPGATASTIRRQCIGPLQSLLSHAERQFEGYRAPRIDKRKWPNKLGRPDWVTQEQWARFITAAGKKYPDTLVPWATFGLYTGARRGDMWALEWSSVHLKDRRVTFKDDKNGDDRECHLPEPAFLALANMKRNGEMVFWFYQNVKDLYAEWNEIRDQVKMPWFTPHILCHSYASWLKNYSGADAKDLLETKRWKSLTSVMRYMHTPETRVKGLIDALPGSIREGKRKRK